MGMYTQCRGWLNVDSISSDDNYVEFENILEIAKAEFQNQHEGRGWVCLDTWLHVGSNGSKFIFFGSELKNYDSDFQKWVEFLLKYFPNAEGRVDIQFENEKPIWEDRSEYWEIYNGEVIKKDRCNTWCYGYGNMWGRQK